MYKKLKLLGLVSQFLLASLTSVAADNCTFKTIKKRRKNNPPKVNKKVSY
jgi:hypothetical protein